MRAASVLKRYSRQSTLSEASTSAGVILGASFGAEVYGPGPVEGCLWNEQRFAQSTRRKHMC